MKKPKIGILPTSRLYLDDNPFNDKYEFVNNYVKDVYQGGCIPQGILLNDGQLDIESLDLYDAFLIPGGSMINPYLFKVLDYAYQNNKPVLGICLGFQAIALYLKLKESNNSLNYNSKDEDVINEIKKEENKVLLLIPEEKFLHHAHEINRDNIDLARHRIDIKDGSLLSEFYETKSLNVVSLHRFMINEVNMGFAIGAVSDDGIIESIENKDKLWLGLLYHPDVDKNDDLISKFVRKVGEYYDRY